MSQLSEVLEDLQQAPKKQTATSLFSMLWVGPLSACLIYLVLSFVADSILTPERAQESIDFIKVTLGAFGAGTGISGAVGLAGRSLQLTQAKIANQQPTPTMPDNINAGTVNIEQPAQGQSTLGMPQTSWAVDLSDSEGGLQDDPRPAHLMGGDL